MPLYWRYLLIHDLKILSLCIFAFIAILLTLRLEEIAQFAALGPSFLYVIWFTLQQIPYILPIALPISALIASLLLISSLSESRELTALRAAGFSLKMLFAPILLAALFLSIANFYIVSEISTATHLNTALSKNQLRAINPLLLMSNKHVMKLKGFYFDVMGPSQVGEFVQDFVFVTPNRDTNRVNLLIAKKLSITDDRILGEQLTLLSDQNDTAIPSPHQTNVHKLMVENLGHIETKIEDFSRLLDKKSFSINHDHLSFSQLLMRKKDAKVKLEQLIATGADKSEIKQARALFNTSMSEIARRLSVGLVVFSFTLLGLAFSIQISRKKNHRSLLMIMLLATLYLVAFFSAKRFENTAFTASVLYAAPHLLIWGCALQALRKVSKGKE